MKKIVLVLLLFFSALSASAENLSTPQMLQLFELNPKGGSFFVENKTCSASYEVGAEGSLNIQINTPGKPVTTARLGSDFTILQSGSMISAVGEWNGDPKGFRINYRSNALVIDSVSLGDYNHGVSCGFAWGDIIKGEYGYDGNRALDISLMSEGGRFDIDTENLFYRVVGENISKRILEQIVVTGSGDEGGHRFCLKINANYLGEKLKRAQESVQAELREKIKPARGTSFQMTLKKTCE